MAKAIISEDEIQVVDHVPDWAAAVKMASVPLIRAKVITNEYVDHMIQSVKENGPYMVLTDYFALMHARPGEGVNKPGMSLLVTKQSVDLAGKPVKIFLIMAAVDNTSHLKSLQKVMSVFMDDHSYQTILAGNRRQIITLLKKSEVAK
ncbi:MAG: PTS sugar transporter subunit IIA [Schleiferilactobacillus perolens]|uniref:PTS sugar transporter subunit IIA n=1 Tax=Schleiferilactobacillus perolens TaxID=100468 RepID=UPI0039ECE406